MENLKYGLTGRIPPKLSITKFNSYYADRDKMPAHQSYFDFNSNTISKSNDFKNLLVQPTVPLGVVTLPKKKKRSQDTVFENKPFTGLKIVGVVDSRKRSVPMKAAPVEVLLPQGFIIQLQADVFLEALLQDGIDLKTQQLKSEFVFATINGSAKLIRVGSDLHKACLENMELKKLPKIGTKTMSVGEVYETKAGKMGVFLGFVTTKYLKEAKAEKKGDIAYAYSKCGFATLWYEPYWYGGFETKAKRDECQKDFDEKYNKASFGRHVNFKIGSSHSFVHKVKGFRIDVPDDVIFKIKRDACNISRESLTGWLDGYPKHLEELKKNKPLPKNDIYSFASYRHNRSVWTPPASYDIDQLAMRTKKTNMTVFGMEPEPHHVSEKLLEVVSLYNLEQEIRRNPSAYRATELVGKYASAKDPGSPAEKPSTQSYNKQLKKEFRRLINEASK
jgi:hypothetical protein